VRIAGYGHVAWTFEDTTGMLRTVKLHAYYIPAAGVPLLSTTNFMHKTGEKLEGDTSCLRLTGLPGSPISIEAPINPETNLPTAYIQVPAESRVPWSIPL
jgi:hypothetical protein